MPRTVVELSAFPSMPKATRKTRDGDEIPLHSDLHILFTYLLSEMSMPVIVMASSHVSLVFPW